MSHPIPGHDYDEDVQPCAYPGCWHAANYPYPCCDTSHGKALRELNLELQDPRIFSANWRKSLNAVNFLGDRIENLITIEQLI